MYARLVRSTIAALAVLTLLVSTIPSIRAAAPEVTILPTAPYWQAGTKAHVVGFRYGADRLFDGVLLFNGANAPLVEVRLGCILEATLPGESAPTRVGLLTMPSTDVSVGAKDLGLVTSVPWTSNGIIAILIGLFDDAGAVEVTAKVGIVSARWADGTRFSQRLSAGFRERHNPALDAAYALTGESIVPELLGASAPPQDATASATSQTVCSPFQGYRCILSIVTGKCVGTARCPTAFGCGNRRCVPVIVPPPA